MKIKFLFVAATALLFAACTNDVIQDDTSGGVVTNPTGEAWVSLKIATPQRAFTRALNTPNQITGTADESNVGSFRAIFFDAGKIVTADKLFTRGTDNEFGNPNQPTGTPGKAFKIPAASKQVLIIANPSTKIPHIVAGTTTYATINAAITNEEVSAVSTAQSFMMTNAKGGLEPSTSAGGDADLVLYSSAESAENSPLQINIDRVVSKVRVFTADANMSNDNAAISDAGWVLNATNKAYFPVSERKKTYMEETDRGCISPYDQYKIGSYRIDPNYDTQPDAPAAGGVWTAYEAQYNYYFNANASSITWKSCAPANTDYEYCFENTQTVTHNVWAYTTQVLFKATFLPKGLETPTGEAYTGANVTSGAVTGGDWMMINGGYYTWDLLMLWIKKELTNKYTDQNPENFNTTLANALNTYLVAIGEEAVDIPQTYDDITYTTPADQANDIVASFNAKNAAVVAKGARRHGTFSYYKGGLSYYPIMIKHDNEDSNEVMNELGEFGVVRNSVYDIRITQIHSPGYPIIPDPNPNTPDEEEQNYLSVQINVNPWTWYTQEVPL